MINLKVVGSDSTGGQQAFMFVKNFVIIKRFSGVIFSPIVEK